ncbi:hypothetical protein DUI87_19043 [Hirundo rustica rustica]|uniref:Uncharacterized protein n=1 Tax=Hirundo rustica rustica TaxID=333673 RepID=A0A3M0JYM1_HIRRU|nr:hypothetical protein DUI87_19043 [Hirundo rustica rustica]
MMSPPGQAAALAGTRLPGNQVPQGTGVPAPSNPEVPEQRTGAETAASSCSIPTLAPVTFRNARGGNNRAEYHPFPRATIKEICKAHRIYGRDGPYFRGLLRADLSAEEVVPADLKYLFTCLLNSTEYILWVTAWKRLLQEALPGLLNHVNTRVDAQGNPLTLDHLAGEGQWAEATDQVVIPVQCLHVVRETALTAFFSMQTQGPAISYSKIRQDQSESFTDFVERLSRAIEAQVKNEMAREHILSEIAFSNANDLCRAAILSLPLHPKPTLPDMLQLTEGLHLKDDNWNFVSVDNSEQGTWPRVKGKLIVVGDCKHTPKEIEILPGTLDNNPGKFVLWLRCTHPPTFLPKGQTVAQIIPTWEHLEEDNIPTACPVHNITEVKPQVGWFELQEDKVQRMPPWRYLGLEIGKRTIVPQKLEIKAKIQTLADVHQLCGALNWVPLQNRYEALDLESQPDDLEGNYLPSEPPNYDSSVRRISTSNIKKKRRVIVAGSDDIEKSIKVIKRDFRALGQVVDKTGAQDKEVDNLFYKQLKNVSGSSALVLVGDFNLPDVCWELNTAEKRQSRKFLECMEDNFLLQLVGEPTRGETMLDLLFANRDGLVGDVVVGGHLGQSDHEIIEFSIFGEIRRNTNKTLTLDFWRADFGLFRRLIQRVPWEAALKNKGVQER